MTGVISCPKCGAEVFYDENKSAQGVAHTCWNCNKALCYVRETNIGSKKCILNNGGKLETKIYREEDGVVLEKYWLYLGEK